jgi:hypothetical protein
LSSLELAFIEIVESDIIDSAIEVGSGCKWRGTGKEREKSLSHSIPYNQKLMYVNFTLFNIQKRVRNLWQE